MIYSETIYLIICHNLTSFAWPNSILLWQYRDQKESPKSEKAILSYFIFKFWLLKLPNLSLNNYQSGNTVSPVFKEYKMFLYINILQFLFFYTAHMKD